jgi:hypothetical protein
MMKKTKIFVVLLLVLLALGVTSRGAESGTFPERWEGYPYSREGGFQEMAAHWIQHGAMYYRAEHGIWPESWRAVIDDGLFQATLYSPFGDVIDPDDGSIDHPCDAVYNQNGLDAKVLKNVVLRVPSRIETVDIFPMESYESVFSALSVSKPETNPGEILDDPRHLKLCAMAGMLRVSLEDFYTLRDRYPATLHELTHSGIGCFGSDSLNPLTGKPFEGNGRPLDFLYEVYDGGFSLNPVLADGSLPTLRMNW